MLSPLSRESNYKDSLKKFFIDFLKEQNVPVTFDKMLNFPDIFQETFRIRDDKVDKWVSVISGGIYESSPLISTYPSIFICSRRDNEGYKLAQLRDLVKGKIDEGLSIPFYRSYPEPTEWELIGSMTVYHLGESEQLTTQDSTKFKRMSLELKWASTI